MRVALAQLNTVVGDLEGNLRLLVAASQTAKQQQADLVVFSELAICGYPPKDLLLRHGFVTACQDFVMRLACEAPQDIGILVGHPTHAGVPLGRIGNAASLIQHGRIQSSVIKTLLPNYDVFDERRYFHPAETVRCTPFNGVRLGVHICEDAWYREPGTAYHLPPENRRDPVADLAADGAELLINLSASPFELEKPNRRLQLVKRHVEQHGIPFLFVNQVGGNDDLVFDGNSLAVDRHGTEVLRLNSFLADLQCVDVALSGEMTSVAQNAGHVQSGPGEPSRRVRSREADLLDALILGLQDYARKSGFTDCVLGLSGGIDSALAAYVAARAVGPNHVHGLAMPSRHSSGHSISDARALASNLGIDFQVVPIDDVHHAYEQQPIVGSDILTQPQGLADQNLQARIRGAHVMIRSNRHGWLALATGNKSELAVGYCTLYGDMAGGFAVLADVLKRDVYAVSRYINEVHEGREVIPVGSLTKPPSAELAPDQFDQDTLPPYPVLDAILEGLIEKELSVAELSTQFPAETVRWVQTKLDRNEFKRRQMPPGIKLSARAFGTGRRMPMAAKFDWEVK